MTNLIYLKDVMKAYRELANGLVKTREPIDAGSVRESMVNTLRNLRKQLPESFTLQVGDLVSNESFLFAVELVMNATDEPFKFNNDVEHYYQTGYVARLIHNEYKLEVDNGMESPLEIRAKSYALPLTSGKEYCTLVKEVNELINCVNDDTPPSLKVLMILLEEVRQAIIKWQSPHNFINTALWEFGK